MSDFQAALGPKQLGVEILVHVAKQRLSGTLTFGPPSKSRQLLFREGRPEAGSETEGQPQTTRPQVVALLRAFAATSVGRCVFVANMPPPTPSLGIDTLGESLLAVMQTLQTMQLESLFSARGTTKVEATPMFAKLAAAIVSLGGPALTAPSPARLDALAGQADSALQRAWAAQLLLGGLKMDGWALVFDSATVASPSSASAPSPIKQEVDAAFAKLAGQDHYAFLAVPRDSANDVIRKAYFEQAKRWHGDRLVGANLDPETKAKAEELFRRADEANKVLSNAEDRKTYDWVIERQAAGLPTDPQVVMEAEGLFRRGETLVRRGQAAAAEPLLRQAVQLNKGEPEFWVYLGFAIYAVQGSAGLVEAQELLQKALKTNPKLDAAQEFLGRIAHSENDRSKAVYHLNQALELNPKNTFAERELRLLNMRQEQEKKPEKDKGLLGRLLKR